MNFLGENSTENNRAALFLCMATLVANYFTHTAPTISSHRLRMVRCQVLFTYLLTYLLTYMPIISSCDYQISDCA